MTIIIIINITIIININITIIIIINITIIYYKIIRVLESATALQKHMRSQISAISHHEI